MCQNYRLPKGFKPDMSKPLLDFAYDVAKEDMRFIAPFVAAGDLSQVEGFNDKTVIYNIKLSRTCHFPAALTRTRPTRCPMDRH